MTCEAQDLTSAEHFARTVALWLDQDSLQKILALATECRPNNAQTHEWMNFASALLTLNEHPR